MIINWQIYTKLSFLYFQATEDTLGVSNGIHC